MIVFANAERLNFAINTPATNLFFVSMERQCTESRHIWVDLIYRQMRNKMQLGLSYAKTIVTTV